MGRSIREGLSDLKMPELNSAQGNKLLRMIARIMEDSYRRGAQQAVTLQQHKEFNCDILKVRHQDSLDKSPRLETGKPMGGGYSSSLYRLCCEYGPYLVDAGFDADFIHKQGD